MSYMLIRVHSFECDYPGCIAEEEHAEPNKSRAEELIRKSGWIKRDGNYYCSEHASVDPRRGAYVALDLLHQVA